MTVSAVNQRQKVLFLKCSRGPKSASDIALLVNVVISVFAVI